MLACGNTADVRGRVPRIAVQSEDNRAAADSEWGVYIRMAGGAFLVSTAWWMLVACCLAETRLDSVFSQSDNFLVPMLDRSIPDWDLVPLDQIEDAGIPTVEAAYEQRQPEQGLAPSPPDSVPDYRPSPGSAHFLNEEWQVLPDGLLYRSYLAGPKESRLQFLTLYDTQSRMQLWEATLGGRAGLLRCGTPGAQNPEGFQIDLEGAVFARVYPEEPSSQLVGSDYRVGLLGTWRQERLSAKAGYYHISSHVGDEFLLANPLFQRVNYVRDSLVAGMAWDLTQESQIYAEIAHALARQGGAKPLEFQLGAQYAPAATRPQRGAPFAAVNGHVREDFGWITGVNLVAGWGWEGPTSRRRLRVGGQYYNGPSLQYSFLNQRENLIGGGIWFDF